MLWSLCCIHGSVCCPQRLNNTEKLRQLISTDQIRHHHLRPGGSLQCYKHNSCEASFPASVQRVDGLLPLICSTIFAMAQWTGVFDLDGVCHVGEMISAPADVLKGRSLDSESRCQSKGHPTHADTLCKHYQPRCMQRQNRQIQMETRAWSHTLTFWLLSSGSRPIKGLEAWPRLERSALSQKINN